MPPAGRLVEVAPERLDRWLTGFAARHGSVSVEPGDLGPMSVVAADGARASFEYFTHDPLGVVLVRRGGYAIGLARGGTFTDTKVGTRYVQSRTAAGGWSQQRFARRRGNQATALVAAVASHTVRLLLTPLDSSAVDPCADPDEPQTNRLGAGGMVVGGDRALVADVLADPRLRALSGLPRRELFDLPDPRRDVLDRALQRGRAVRVVLADLPT